MTLLDQTSSGWPPIVFPEGPKATAKRILRETCERHGVKVESVCGPRRYKPLVMCRREAAWLIAKETTLSYPQIAMLLNKDHTSILMAIRRQNEATGENVRGSGGIPEKTRARNIASARRCRRASLGQRMRMSELKRNREDYRL